MSVSVKICGLSTEAGVAAALDGGADYVGFVFYPKSPRAVSLNRARDLAAAVRGRARIVGLFVSAAMAEIERAAEAVPLDAVQLHGDETPDFCRAVRQRTGRLAIKALPIAGSGDFAGLDRWADAADLLLFDAKPPSRADALPGGNGESFDWTLLAGRPLPLPWMLAGGLDPGNVASAIRQSGARLVDVSSGVETSPGIKDPALIRAFLAAAKA